MSRRRASLTAQQIAGLLVAAAAEPELRPLLDDPDQPWSARFLAAAGPLARLRLRAWRTGWTRRRVFRFSEDRAPGAVLFILLRRRWVHGELLDWLERTPRPAQVVSLGSGLDPTPWVLSPRFPGVSWYDLDLPAVQAAKRRAGGTDATPAVRLLDVDLLIDRPAAALEGTGFSPEAPTFWLAEGLLPYLPGPIVERLLGEVRALSAPGSRLVVTVLDREACARAEGPVARLLRDLERLGEPVLSAVPRDGLGAWLASRGFGRVAVLGHEELRREFLGGDPAPPLLDAELLVRAEIEPHCAGP